MKKKLRIQSPNTSKRMSMRQRAFFLVWIIGIIGLSILIAKYRPRSLEPTEQTSCNNYCQIKFGTDGYLKKLHETLSSDHEQMRENLSTGREKLFGNLSAGLGSQYIGPWRCICQTE